MSESLTYIFERVSVSSALASGFAINMRTKLMSGRGSFVPQALHLWEAEAAIDQARTQLLYAELARGEQR